MNTHVEAAHEGKKPHECEHCHEGFADEQNLKSHMESDCEKIKIQKLRGESKNQTPDDNTDNENLLEHDEKEEAITNNNKIPQEVQIEVIEGIKLNDIDWNNVEYIYVPEIVEKPIDTDPSSNKLDQAEAIEEPILEEIADQNPEDHETNNCEIIDQDSSSKSPPKEHHKAVIHDGNKPQFACEICEKTFTRHA